MQFDIDSYKGKYAMHCKTEEEARDFCDYLHSIGRTWTYGNTYKSTTCYSYYGKETTYNFNEGLYCNVQHYKKEGYTILEWEDFMNKKFTKADLKTGDIILRRNHWVEIVNLELDMLIRKTGWNDLANINEDLTDKAGDEYDIMAVRRPNTKGDCQFTAFDYEHGALIYQRPKVEEMTLEQVCKLLGKEIKIIK